LTCYAFSIGQRGPRWAHCARSSKWRTSLSGAPLVGAEVLSPILRFSRQNRGIAVELAFTNRNEDLSRGDAAK
jgi:hypothetical protein